MDRAFRDRVLAAATQEGPERAARAASWLEELPSVVKRWRRHWDLGPLTQLPAGAHWVGRGLRGDGRGCVLKLAPPGATEPLAEVSWLRCVTPGPAARGAGRADRADRAEMGVRAVELLDADPAAGAQLLELVEPGTPLADELRQAAGTSRFEAVDDAACEVLAGAAGAVRRPPPDPAAGLGLGSVRGHLEGLFAVAEGRDARHRVLPRGPVLAAADQARHLLASAREDGRSDALLHGDLHHDNVLRRGAAGRRRGSTAPASGDGRGGWVVIDPHGVVGEPAYELACAVYNPFALGRLAAERAEVRCERLAEAAGLPPDRVRGWALVQAVLSAVWSSEGSPTGAQQPNAQARHTLAVAERLGG